MLWGAKFGLLAAVLALVVGALRIAAALADGRPIRFDDLHILAFYVGGFVLAGAAIGVLWPFTRTSWGRYSVGVFGASLFVSSFVIGIFGQPAGWDGAVIFSWGFTTIFVGSLVGYRLKKPEIP